MMRIVFCTFLYLFPYSTIGQFPNHLDIRILGEINFKDEKFKVYKPSLHVVSDYFAESMMKDTHSSFPTKRTFVDDNGFRHYWSGLEGGKIKSLRKTHIADEMRNNKVDNNLSSKKDVEVQNKFEAYNILDKILSTVFKEELTINENVPKVKTLSNYGELDKMLNHMKYELKSEDKHPVKKQSNETFLCPLFGKVVLISKK